MQTRRIVTGACVLLAAVAAIGQERPAPTFSSAITVVTLPVFVTDGRGVAVEGLEAEQFEVLDDGRPVKVVGFREIEVDDEPLAEAEDSPAARRQFLLLFDLSFSNVNGLVRAQKSSLEFVTRRLSPTDLAAVATFSANHGVRLLLGFTSDRHQLRRAVATLGLLQRDAHADPLGLAFDLREVGATAADTLPDERGEFVADSIRAIQSRYERAQEAIYRTRVLALLDGMGRLAKVLDVVQGRKQIIYFSSGFDEAALQGQQGAQQIQESEAVSRGRLWEVRSESRFGDTQIRQEMARMLEAFSSSDSLVHSVDLSGLSARGDARQQSSEPARRSGQGSLSEFARLSGGRFFQNTNDPGQALGEILDMSRHYYLLAFEPPQVKGAGRFHKLKVRVKASLKNSEVSHRAGYFERTTYSERPALARRFEAAEIIAKGVKASEIPLRVLTVPYRTEGKVTLPVVLEIDVAALLASAPKDRLSLELYGYALDGAGSVEDFVAFTSTLELDKVGARLRDRGLQWHAAFTVPPGKHSLRFLVRDADSGRTGAQWLEVTVPAFDPAEVLMFPPLFMDSPERWLIIGAPSRASAGARSPFHVSSAAFTPRASPSLANGRTEQVCLLVFDGGRRRDPGASFEIDAQIASADGASRALGQVQLTRSETEPSGFRRFVLELTPRDLRPGDYTLRVSLRDPASGRLSQSYQAVRVE